jgi:hypothetical protein
VLTLRLFLEDRAAITERGLPSPHWADVRHFRRLRLTVGWEGLPDEEARGERRLRLKAPAAVRLRGGAWTIGGEIRELPRVAAVETRDKDLCRRGRRRYRGGVDAFVPSGEVGVRPRSGGNGDAALCPNRRD